MAATDASAHWRDSARNARFFIVDAYAAFPLVLVLVHMRLWTFMTAIIVMAFFMVLERFKFTVPVFIRWTKSTLAGPIKQADTWWRN